MLWSVCHSLQQVPKGLTSTIHNHPLQHTSLSAHNTTRVVVHSKPHHCDRRGHTTVQIVGQAQYLSPVAGSQVGFTGIRHHTTPKLEKLLQPYNSRTLTLMHFRQGAEIRVCSATCTFSIEGPTCKLGQPSHYTCT